MDLRLSLARLMLFAKSGIATMDNASADNLGPVWLDMLFGPPGGGKSVFPLAIGLNDGRRIESRRKRQGAVPDDPCSGIGNRRRRRSSV